MSCVQVRKEAPIAPFWNLLTIKYNQHFFLWSNSKSALLEGLEVDQYMLGILVYIQKWVLICVCYVNNERCYDRRLLMEEKMFVY